MTGKTLPFISIIKKNFGKKNEVITLIFILLFSALGFIEVFINWKSWLCAACIVLLIGFLWKKTNKKFLFLMAGVIIAGVCYFSEELDIDILETLVTLLFLPFLFFIKPYYQTYKKVTDFEVFYLDHKQLRCLVTLEDSDYKGYALNPKNYLKKYSFQQIKAIKFDKQNLTIAIDNLLIHPRELTSTDLNLIHGYIQQYFPDLLKNEQTIAENSRKDNQYYLKKLLIFSPVILLAPVIYFFGDNGKNSMITIPCLLLMVICPLIIYKILNTKN
ncbi:hypothetical protein [Chryseobacterium sp. M5A1_1a]